jgi:putative ABC transport system permease protein
MAYGLLREDYDRIVANVPTLLQAVPMREITKEVRYLSNVTDARIVGCTAKFLEMNNLTVARHRFISDKDLEEADNVAVLGSATARALFPYQDPVGKVIQIEDQFYDVVGTTASKTPSAGIGGSLTAQDYNSDVYIPLSTLRWRIGDMVITARSGSREGELVELSQITVTVRDIEQVDQTADIIEALLRKYHPNDDYAIVVPKELLRQAEILQMMFNLLLVLIAGIALLVGGIGIMNIMLATVTERTREIGIRRALGAKQRDIVAQFLSETVVLSATGGALGVFFGFLVNPVIDGTRYAINRLLPDVLAAVPDNIRDLEPRIAAWSVIAAFMISVAVGVLFGLYPAQRAARMDPIEALRHE